MAHITFENLNVGWHLGFATGKVQALRENLRERYGRYRRCRTMIAELRQCSPDQLAELGISHGDIHFIAEDGTRY